MGAPETTSLNIPVIEEPQAERLPRVIIYGSEHMRAIVHSFGQIAGQLAIETKPVAEASPEAVEV